MENKDKNLYKNITEYLKPYAPLTSDTNEDHQKNSDKPADVDERPEMSKLHLHEYHVKVTVEYGEYCYVAYASDHYDAARLVLDDIHDEGSPVITTDITKYTATFVPGDLHLRADVTKQDIYKYGEWWKYTLDTTTIYVTEVEPETEPIAYCIGGYGE